MFINYNGTNIDCTIYSKDSNVIRNFVTWIQKEAQHINYGIQTVNTSSTQVKAMIHTIGAAHTGDFTIKTSQSKSSLHLQTKEVMLDDIDKVSQEQEDNIGLNDAKSKKENADAKIKPYVHNIKANDEFVSNTVQIIDLAIPYKFNGWWQRKTIQYQKQNKCYRKFQVQEVLFFNISKFDAKFLQPGIIIHPGNKSHVFILFNNYEIKDS